MEILTQEGWEEIHFLTSDHHIGHINIAKFTGRPFDNSESTDQMDSAIFAYWQQIIDPEDNVLLLGDIAMGNIEDSLNKWADLPHTGKKFLIPGNHDRVSSAYSPSHNERFMSLYIEAGFTVLPELVDMRILASDEGDEISLRACHYPYTADSHDDPRYAHLRPERPADERHALLVHGHTHSHSITNDEDLMEYHVGIDAHNLAPVPVRMVEEWARNTLKALRL